MRSIKRGEVYTIDFGNEVVGSEQGGKRLGVILQNNKGNLHSPTVIVATITSKCKKVKQPTHVIVHDPLREVSCILLEQLKTISVDRLGMKIGELSERDMKRVDRALSISLGLN